MSTSTAIFTPKEALFRDFLAWEHILESFKLSESVSTFILSWKLSLLDLICSQLSENALRAKSRVFCHFWSFETLAFFTFCWFWPSRSHWRPFLDLESTKALWLSYPNLFLHLIYLYPFPCKSSEKIDSFFMAEQSKYICTYTLNFLYKKVDFHLSLNPLCSKFLKWHYIKWKIWASLSYIVLSYTKN